MAAKEPELSVQMLRARLSTLVDGLDVGVLLEDEQGRIQNANESFCRMFMLAEEPASLVEQPSARLHATISNSFEQPEAFVQRIAELTQKLAVEDNEICRLADGRALERDYRPVLLDGACVGHVWTYRDVSRRERDRAQLLRAAARMDNASNSDELTGLYNRRGFRTLGERLYAEARARHQHAVMVFADIDGLKEINAQLGHETGDSAIRATGEILRAVFASPDPIARLGADEFAILSIQNEPKSAAHVQAKLQEAVDAWNQEGFRTFELSLSIGVAVSDTRSLDLGALMAAADAALYAKKLEQRSTRPPIVK